MYFTIREEKYVTKAKYNFLHLFYWFTGCCINGFIAVFLQSKGLSNTEIGIVTGGSCVATIFLSPFMSSLISKIKGHDQSKN